MRLRREPEMDPSTRRELEALDAALAGLPVDPRDEELASLAVALREERPLPRPEFALDLDLRARDGFPAAEAAKPPCSVAAAPPAPLGPGARHGCVAVHRVDRGADVGRRRRGPPVSRDGAGALPSPRDVPRIERPRAVCRRRSRDRPARTLRPPSAGVAPRVRDRKVERGASLTLSTPRDEIEDVADGAVRVTDRHGGFVLSSSVSSGEGTEAGATLDLRIPSARLQPALADLSELAHVRARTQDARDITAAFTSPRRRLSDALAERRGLLRQLARADTPNETAAVRARLRAVNRRIDRVPGRAAPAARPRLVCRCHRGDRAGRRRRLGRRWRLVAGGRRRRCSRRPAHAAGRRAGSARGAGPGGPPRRRRLACLPPLGQAPPRARARDVAGSPRAISRHRAPPFSQQLIAPAL